MRYSFCLLLFLMTQLMAQKGLDKKVIHISIDDIPRSRTLDSLGQSPMLNMLDLMDLPVSIFINESLCFSEKGLEPSYYNLLEKWCSKPYVSLGNHTYSHLRFSKVGRDSFLRDLFKGEVLTAHFAKKYNKDYKYFRFPYNDLGSTQEEHTWIVERVNRFGFEVTPFTIESSDWMFNAVYQRLLKEGKTVEAKKIGELYVEKTMEWVAYFEDLVKERHNRSIPHIYLCHDNKLNADYLPEIVSRLKSKGYVFVSLEEALSDPIYSTEDHFYQKWGISWIYRWIENPDDRKKAMKSEPKMDRIIQMYEAQ